MKKSVLYKSPALTQSGYGVHSRQVAKWLLSKQELDVKFIVTPWGDTPWLLNRSAHNGLVGEIMERSVAKGTKASASVQLVLPNEWELDLGMSTNIGITAAVETDRCSQQWSQMCTQMTRVIVPSKHAKVNLESNGPLSNVFVIPESYSDAIASTKESNLPLWSTSFNFLVFGQITGNTTLTDRKNLFNTVKWICDTFKDDSDVGIVIKTNAGRNSKIDKNVTINMITSLLKEVRKGRSSPPVYLLHGDMSDEEVAMLYKHPQIKALASITRGEGFGLPILEAAASGLPVIATDWSGHLDFLRLGKFLSVKSQLVNVHESKVDGNIFVQGSRWAEPSEEDFKRRLTKFKESPSAPKQWAIELSEKLLNSHSFSSISKAYDEVLGDLLLT